MSTAAQQLLLRQDCILDGYHTTSQTYYTYWLSRFDNEIHHPSEYS